MWVSTATVISICWLINTMARARGRTGPGKICLYGRHTCSGEVQYGVNTGSNFNIIYQWLPAGDQAYEPTMAVDDNIASFTDPATGQVQTDASTGNVYIAWASGSVIPSLQTGDPFFNPNPILMVSSSDGGQSFSGVGIANTSGYGPTTERDSEPEIVISQGRLPSESGEQGDAGIPGGEVTVGWADFAANENQLMVNSISPGKDYRFDGATGFITGNAFPPTTTTATNFPVTIAIPNSQIAALDSLSVTVDITDTNDGTLGLKLIAPDGESITLFTNNSLEARCHGPRAHRRECRDQ